MSFQNVDMGPIEAAFHEWQEAKAAAKLARRYVEESKNRTVRPLIRVNVETVSTTNGTGLQFENKGADAIGAFLALAYTEDPAGIVDGAVQRMEAEAEEKRAAFLRATLGGLAGD